MNRKTKKSVKHVPLPDRRLLDLARQGKGVVAVAMMSASDVVTAPWVRLKCQFGCGGYGQCLVCPPFTPTPDQMRAVLNSYNRAILIQFDENSDVKPVVADLERSVFLLGAWKAFGLGAGPCYFCGQCDLNGKECRHPERARPAMEACGIDVFSTVRKAGFTIEVVENRRQCPHYYGLLLVD